jgi:tryptophan halogenase
MNYLKGYRKISVIGAGTAGSMAVAHFKHFTDYELDWYYDTNIPPQSVGEGTTLSFTKWLHTIGVKNFEAIEKLDATSKIGILKENWSSNDFIHNFPLSYRGIHLNASKLQKLIQERFQNKVNTYNRSITHNEIDSSFIIDCSGFSNDTSKFIFSECTPVNSACTYSVPWKFPEFNYTKAVAMKFGWCFIIPLQNRCSYGYVFDESYISKEEACEELAELVRKKKVTFNQEHAKFVDFKNYYRKVNFEERTMYNGNASFFLEPMEATSLSVVELNLRKFYDYINGILPLEVINERYLEEMKDLELMISCHYLCTPYKNKFWTTNNKKTKKFIKTLLNENRVQALNYNLETELGSWPKDSWKENIEGLEIREEIDEIIKTQ